MSNVIQIRPFCEDDCARCVEIANLSRPESAIAEDRLRQDDAQWDASRYFQVRLVAEDAGGRAVGWGQIGHTPWQYEPHKQELVLRVDPAYQRQGFGSALYEHLLIEASAHGARVIRSAVFETHPEGIEFLTHRGFTELQRMWRSRLDVDAFDDSRFDGAEERVRAQGIAITTLAAERQLNEDAVRKAYELRSTCFATVPSLDPLTPVPYDMFVRDWSERRTRSRTRTSWPRMANGTSARLAWYTCRSAPYGCTMRLLACCRSTAEEGLPWR